MNLSERVHRAVSQVPILDFHTHLYQPSFGMTLWGVDELVTYHYLVAEVMRFAPLSPTEFLKLPKPQQADVIWENVFVRNTPISEAATGVTNVLNSFGLDPRANDLTDARKFFAAQNPATHLHRVMDMAGVQSLVMTNDPLDPVEAPNWENKMELDPRFLAALRIDPLLNNWPDATERLKVKGYKTGATADEVTLVEIRRFLKDWIKIMQPRYMAVSLPPSFAYPEDSHRITVLAKAVLPVCEEFGLPFAMMIGVNKRVHPELVEAGDSVALSDMTVVERLCHSFPKNRFLVTVLARENQQGLCIAARKFANLLPFGCWWFMNNPSLVYETTLMRLETLGPTFVPQHSDARVMEQLIYKWSHSRRDIGNALTTRYEALERAGRTVTDQDIARDANLLLHDNAATWINA